ncbi:UNVERIFIED_CONTAM: MAP3K12-binding inhibitory protein 1 [Trichonephila clavipes]
MCAWKPCVLTVVFVPSVSRVRNVWGPQTRAVVEEAKQTDNESNKLEHMTTDYIAIEERLSSMEVHLKLKESTVKKNIFQRIKELEDRILYLEGTTPELLISPSTSNESPPPKKQNTDKYAVKREAETDKYDNWSIDDVQRRIDFLTESLKSKYPAAKNL